MSYVVLALKWRPQTFDEVAGQEAIGQTLKNAIDSGRTAHAYLFTGPRGVGKTSTARILAKALNCEKGPTSNPDNTCDACREITTGRSLDVLEIDGASNRGIDDIRELRESVRYAPAGGRTKVYIIDEVHMLTTDAFNALLKTLEEPPSHVVFVLATTEPLKVPATIVSRCQRFDFARLRMRDTLGRLHTICSAEGIEISEDALSLIARRAEGSMRDALTLLDQVIASGRRPLDGPGVAAAIGISGRDLYFEISEAILAQDPNKALSLLTNAYNEGQNLQEVAEELVAHLRNLLMLTGGDALAEMVDATDVERERYRAQAKRARAADLIRQLHIALEAAAKMRRSAFPRVILEVALAEICLLPRSVDLASFLRGVQEGGGTGGPAGGPSASDAGAAAAGGAGPTHAAGGAAPTHATRGAAPTHATGGARHAATSESTLEFNGGHATSPTASSDDPWPGVIQLIRKKRPALAATLNGTWIAGEREGYLMIHLPAEAGPFVESAIESAESRPILQAAIREAYGRNLGWKVDTAAEESAMPAGANPSGGAHVAPTGGVQGGGSTHGTRTGRGSSAGAKGDAPPANGAKGPNGPKPANGARSNLADIERIAKNLNGDIMGPS